MIGLFKRLQPPWLIWVLMNLKQINTGEITTDEFFTNSYTEEVYELEHICTAI